MHPFPSATPASRYSLTGFSVEAAKLVPSRKDGRPVWNVSGTRSGNYIVRYSGADGKPVYFDPKFGRRLYLEIVEPKYRIDLTTSVLSGHGITEAKLQEFLSIVERLAAWCEELPCRLVVVDGGETMVSNETTIQAPVEPWQQALEPELFARDNTIRYCSVVAESDSGDEKEFYVGRDLTMHGRFRCFTYKEVLETSPAWRGFACIGFVAAIKGVKHDPKVTGDSPSLVRHLNGKEFDVPASFKEGRRFEKKGNWVEIGPLVLRDYLLTTEGRAGDHYIWRPGHAGLIRNGKVYECKPTGRGFTKLVYDERRHSSVLGWEPDQFLAQLKSKDTFFVSRLF
jgi:hypothetical protein